MKSWIFKFSGFLQIISSEKNVQNEIKLVPEMLNLLGCSKENFLKLIKMMGYKIFEKNNDIYFKYSPTKKVKKATILDSKNADNPFKILKEMRFK